MTLQERIKMLVKGVERAIEPTLREMRAESVERAIEPTLRAMKVAERRGELKHEELKYLAKDYRVKGIAKDRAGIESMLSIK